jgi:Kelch motif
MIFCDPTEIRNSRQKKDKSDLLESLCQNFESHLYAISGFFDQPLNSIEKLDMKRGIWTEISGVLNIPRTKF